MAQAGIQSFLERANPINLMQRSITTRLTALITVMVALAVLCVSLLSGAAARGGALPHARELAAALAQTRDPAGEAARFARLPAVKAVAVVDSSGAIVASAGRTQIDPALRARAAAAGSAAIGVPGGAVGVAPAPDGRRVIVVYSSAALDAAADRRWWEIMLFSIAITLLFAMISALLLNRVSAPLQHLIAFTQQASIQRLGMRVDVRTGDELETLARGLNKMMQRLDAAMKRMQRLAFVDPVTELPNRERFRHETAEIVKAAGEGAPSAAVLLLDLDRFQRFYETVGQNAGEELLAAASERLIAAVRAADRIVRLQTCEQRPTLLARWAGSEFAILLPDVDRPTDAGRFAQLVAASLRQPFEIGAHRMLLGASVGVALAPQDGACGDEVIRAAEVALSQARAAGGARAMFFTRKMNEKALNKLVLENEIRTGLEQGQFVAYFQPKIDLATGRICGAEALARWLHPTRGLVSPGEFIQAAEESGLINPMGEAVLRDACRRSVDWLRRGVEVKVAVNVSPTQFATDRFPDIVLGMLAETGLPPGLLELEITESVAMNDPDRVFSLIDPLRRRGVRFAIDDFGTGHSNLAALTRLPFDVFKIDRSFVQGLGGGDRQAQVLIETILAMAKSLQFQTVAEGVETPEQAAALRRAGCGLGQGYLFGAPMPPEQFEERARAWMRDTVLSAAGR